MALTRGFVKNAATTPLDTRLMDAGLVASNADGSARTGVLGYLPSIVSTNGDTSPMSLSVAPAPFIISKGLADGITRPTNDGVTKVTIAAAPGTAGTSRYDVLWVKHNDDTTGDANALPVFGVTSGAAASSPTEPALAAGQERLGALRIYSGTTSTSGGGNVFTNDYKMTVAQGGIVPFRSLAEMNAWTTAREGQPAQIGTSGGLWERRDGAWVKPVEDSGWITPSLPAGWTHQAGETFQYRKVDGWVCFRGRLLTGSPASTTIFTLPAGFRPEGYANNIFAIYPSPRRTIISNTGAVVTDSVGELVSFGNVTFRGV